MTAALEGGEWSAARPISALYVVAALEGGEWSAARPISALYVVEFVTN